MVFRATDVESAAPTGLGAITDARSYIIETARQNVQCLLRSAANSPLAAEGSPKFCRFMKGQGTGASPSPLQVLFT